MPRTAKARKKPAANKRTAKRPVARRKAAPAAKAELYLFKANDKGVCFCKCERAPASFSHQMDCPWCGCGWLFTCLACRKAFTFAVAAPADDFEALALKASTFGGKKPKGADADAALADMRQALEHLKAGDECVYFDGAIVNTRAKALKLEGLHARHNLKCVPQVAALRDVKVAHDILSNEDYWRKNAIE